VSSASQLAKETPSEKHYAFCFVADPLVLAQGSRSVEMGRHVYGRRALVEYLTTDEKVGGQDGSTAPLSDCLGAVVAACLDKDE
jgi:hypothetical protein